MSCHNHVDPRHGMFPLPFAVVLLRWLHMIHADLHDLHSTESMFKTKIYTEIPNRLKGNNVLEIHTPYTPRIGGYFRSDSEKTWGQICRTPVSLLRSSSGAWQPTKYQIIILCETFKWGNECYWCQVAASYFLEWTGSSCCTESICIYNWSRRFDPTFLIYISAFSPSLDAPIVYNVYCTEYTLTTYNVLYVRLAEAVCCDREVEYQHPLCVGMIDISRQCIRKDAYTVYHLNP